MELEALEELQAQSTCAVLVVLTVVGQVYHRVVGEPWQLVLLTHVDTVLVLL